MPIVAVTAHAMEQDVQESFAAGADGHLAKPFTPAQLLRTICGWIAPRARRAASADGSPAKESAAPRPTEACLDVERGIRQIGGSRELYLDLLHRFACEFGTTPASLGAEIGRGNLAGAALLANSVKEIAGVLAALPLEGAAAELERALSGHRGRVEASLACFGHQLEAVLRSAT